MDSEGQPQNGAQNRSYTVASLPTSSLVPGLRERQRAFREETILSAAMGLIAEVGYDAMTMEDLAERAGISKPTLYQHFPSKEAIAVRAVVRVIERTVAFVEGLETTLPPMERLERIVRQVIQKRFMTEEASFGAARPLLIPVIKKRPEYQEAVGRLIARVGALIEEAKAAGEVPGRLNTRVLTQMVISLVRDSEYEDLIARKECTADEVVDTLVAVYFDGARARKTDTV